MIRIEIVLAALADEQQQRNLFHHRRSESEFDFHAARDPFGQWVSHEGRQTSYRG